MLYDKQNKVDFFNKNKLSKLFKPIVMPGIENLLKIHYLKEHWVSDQQTTLLEKTGYSDEI